ncbi:MAG: hypothetical protein H0U60_19740 [Blastocatellia bacterium]|nr:hypothetical protein [Blastocatellia bacterium]
MITRLRLPIFLGLALILLALTVSRGLRPAKAQTNPHDPTWWSKYEFILNNGSDADAGSTTSVSYAGNVDVSNECGPQSETFITLDPNKPKTLAAGSNEIFRLPMRGYTVQTAERVGAESIFLCRRQNQRAGPTSDRTPRSLSTVAAISFTATSWSFSRMATASTGRRWR